MLPAVQRMRGINRINTTEYVSKNSECQYKRHAAPNV